jgi:hypothetical protein
MLGSGGSALAEKLINIYFTLFKLILEGKLGHGGKLIAAKEAKQAYKGRTSGGKGHPKEDAEHARRAADQVAICGPS